jgi:hypothetical protein
MPSKRKAKNRGRRSDARSHGSRTRAMTTSATKGRFTICRLPAGQICPDRLIVPMKYTGPFTVSGASGAASYTFSQNSVYDPDVTSTGGGCAGFNTLMNLYSKFRVTSSKIRVTIQNGAAVLLAVAVAPSHVVFGAATSAYVIAGQRMAKPHAIKILAEQGHGPAVVLEDSVNTSELLGNELYDSTQLYGSIAADPTLQFYWSLGSNDLNSLPYSFQGIVEIEYLTEYSRPLDLPS